MKRVLTGVAAAVLGVAACGTDNGDPGAQPPPETVTVTAEQSPQPVETTDAATAPEEDAQPTGDEAAETESDSGSTEPTTATTEEATTADTASQPPDDGEPAEELEDVQDRYGNSQLNDRDNLVKEVGQLAAIADPSTGEVRVEFKVTSIEVDFTCTSDWADAPANGHYVAVTFEVNTTPELAGLDLMGGFGIDPYELKVFSPDGTRENDSVGSGFTCLDEGDQLPYDIGPGEHAVGTVVLDTAHPTGSIAYSSYLVDGPSGWEWEY